MDGKEDCELFGFCPPQIVEVLLRDNLEKQNLQCKQWLPPSVLGPGRRP